MRTVGSPGGAGVGRSWGKQSGLEDDDPTAFEAVNRTQISGMSGIWSVAMVSGPATVTAWATGTCVSNSRSVSGPGPTSRTTEVEEPCGSTEPVKLHWAPRLVQAWLIAIPG